MICNLMIEVSVRWWVKPYLLALKIFSLATGKTPNLSRVINFILKHGTRQRMTAKEV